MSKASLAKPYLPVTVAMKPKRKSVALQVADFCGQEYTSVRDAQYQSGHWKPSVYLVGDDYYSAGAKPPKCNLPGSEQNPHNWQLLTNSFGESVWFSKGSE